MKQYKVAFLGLAIFFLIVAVGEPAELKEGTVFSGQWYRPGGELGRKCKLEVISIDLSAKTAQVKYSIGEAPFSLVGARSDLYVAVIEDGPGGVRKLRFTSKNSLASLEFIFDPSLAGISGLWVPLTNQKPFRTEMK